MLNDLKIPRHVFDGKIPVSKVILTFVDASENAYSPKIIKDKFVATRITTIQKATLQGEWHHVSFENNKRNKWFQIHQLQSLVLCPLSKWPLPFVAAKSERRAIPQENPEILVDTTQSPNWLYGINHGNHLIVAYIMRFKRKSSDAMSMVKFEELEQSQKIVLRLIQHNNFSTKIKELKKCRKVGRGSNLSALTLFFDQDDLIRVGGRLEASELSFDAKHPVLNQNAVQFPRRTQKSW